MRFSVVLLAISSVLAMSSIPPAMAAPWEEPQDSASAFTNPDRYAWRLFVAVNWPADMKLRTADPSRKFGDQGPVVWESWRNVRNEAEETVFRPDGTDPGPWATGGVAAARTSNSFDREPIQQLIRSKSLDLGSIILFDPVAAENEINETRLNKTTYEFVRGNQLYNLEGQEDIARKGAANVDFPPNAKEAKAQWREISESDKPRYHWTEVLGDDGKKIVYGLVALHLTTKDLPNWFWATFEHIDNKQPERSGGRAGNEGWLLRSRDRVACSDAPYDCEKIPSGFGLEGTKWENSRLRGTQIEFTDSRGNPVLLANSKPEQGFQTSSSCMTCHARSTIGKRDGTASRRLAIFKVDGTGFTGAPDPSWYNDSVHGHLTQLDFVWSLARARRKGG